MRIEDWGAEIDAVDNELLRLLNRRARLAVGLGTKPDFLSPRLRQRDSEALDRACRANAGPLDERAVARIFRRIVRETQRANGNGSSQRPPKVELNGAHEEVGELV